MARLRASARLRVPARLRASARLRVPAQLRLFVVGGLTSYRALFNWLSPWVLIPVFLIAPIFQILLFALVGRAAGVESDGFFVIGNAVQYAAIPCLFATGSTIGGERNQGTLPLLLVSPARRVPLFLGRALPVIVNGFVVSAVALAVGAAVLRVQLAVSGLAALVVVLVVASFACTGLGLAIAALALRVRQTAVLSNLVFGVLLVFCGVNVPLSELPGWMSTISRWLPLTHGIAAARRAGAGEPLAALRGDLLTEAALGVLYVAVGLAMIAWFERESRRRATLETY